MAYHLPPMLADIQLEFEFLYHRNRIGVDPLVPQLPPGLRFEVMNFGTTDTKKRSFNDCIDEEFAYDCAMSDLGLFLPVTNFETGEIVPEDHIYNHWPDPDAKYKATRHSSALKSDEYLPATPKFAHPASLTSVQGSAFSPTPAQLSAFPSLSHRSAPRPSYAPMTGSGVFYVPLMKSPKSTRISPDSSGYVNVNAMTNTSFDSTSYNDNNDAYETSSVSSSSYLHGSSSAEGSPTDEKDASSDTGSNVADVDGISDTTSLFSSSSDGTEDSDAMAQRAVEGRLMEDIDNETHLASGDIITSDGRVIPLGATPAKPTLIFNRLKKSPIANMLPEFLAQMAAANKELEAEIEAGTFDSRCMEINDDANKSGPFIEMNLGLGVLEEVADTSSSEEESDASQGVMEKLMVIRKKRKFDDEDDEEKEMGQQKKTKFIEEI